MTMSNGIRKSLGVVTSGLFLATGLYLAADPAQAAIVPVVTETGKISLSVDGLGTNNAAGGTIDVAKPAGSTVRRAAFACSSNFNRVIADGDVSIDGTTINWSLSQFTDAGGGNPNFFHTVYADVTAVVSAKIDAAAAGLVPFLVTEVSTTTIDGCILAVISDDPAQTVDRTAILLFGGQSLGGDTFNISVSPPIALADVNLVLDFGLGIGFSAQGGTANLCGGGEFSEVDVNTVRMTSCAGNWDDGVAANGALLTVGGLGDSNANPAPPATLASQLGNVEDELYDLIPFVADGDTIITMDTINPSNDDIIFFAHLLALGRASAGGEEITKELVEGPDPIGISNPFATAYTFVITYTGPDALVVDTVPAEFEIVSLLASDGVAISFDTSQGAGNSANRIEWDVPEGTNTLTVEIQTVQSPGRGHRRLVFKPTSCGPLPINDGAIAFEVEDNGAPVLVEVQVVTDTLALETMVAASADFVEPGQVDAVLAQEMAIMSETLLQRVVIVGPSNSLIVEAVEGAKACEGPG